MSVHTIIMGQGRFMHRDSLTYPFEERSLQFGDGVYEIIRIYQGNYFLLTEHINRLYNSLEAIDITISQSKAELIYLLDELIIKNNIVSDAHVYLQITRGSAERNLAYPEDVEPNIFAYVKDTPRPINELAKGVSVITYPDERWRNCFIKSINLLPNILAKQNAIEHQTFEAILHKDEVVTQCSSANVYLIKNHVIYTHPANHAILNGCTRSVVKKIAEKQGITFNETAFTLTDITSADEMFLTNSINEIMPIIKVDHQTINSGKPGQLTKQLQAAYIKEAKIIT